MGNIIKQKVAAGICWIEVPEADLRVLCGCPANAVKHLKRRGLIAAREEQNVAFETGPNAILVSDVLLQNGELANLAEFPVLHMLYKQGMALPNHPRNTGARPLLIGSEDQIRAQMLYIYRGNYGLVSKEEIESTGVSQEEAEEIYRLKLAMSFNKIRSTDTFLDAVTVYDQPVEVMSGVTVRRRRLNVFEFTYDGETETVDLNLGTDEAYEPAFPLGYHHIPREYFAVLHAGNGDGWDINRPTIASILMFQGRIYLVDAGPGLLERLRSLGIGVAEIEGVFHTHSHDDHFCGLTALLRSDHRIKYYATPLVRASVTKKLAALLSIEEAKLSDFFDVRDLALNAWNDVEGMQVRPIMSPHPVETTVFTFRARQGNRYRTYGHFADIIALSVLERFITDDPTKPGVSQELVDRTREEYLTRLDLKKLDVGGGLIHGNAEDFREDRSSKLVLGHTSSGLTNAQKEIGSGAPFGSIDILIPSQHDYVRRRARVCALSCFPGIPDWEMEALLNHPIITFNPETILVRIGEKVGCIYLLLTGEVQALHGDKSGGAVRSAGAVVGETAALGRTPAGVTYRAIGFVRALEIPAEVYLRFVRRNGLLDPLRKLHEKRGLLQRSWLFDEAIAYPVQNRIATSMNPLEVGPGRVQVDPATPAIYLVDSGELELRLDGQPLESLRVGDFYGEDEVLYGTSSLLQVHAIGTALVYAIPADALTDVPAVRWHLIEVRERRMRMILKPDTASAPIFQWREEYCIGVPEMDQQHQFLFETAARVQATVESGPEKGDVAMGLQLILAYAETHFADEEDLMEREGFAGYKEHCLRHRHLIEEITRYAARLDADERKVDRRFLVFLKEWVLEHILTEDRQYGTARDN
ncbi:MAG: bacteriohemerythrin [Lentisphaerae bacterium]|jgi:hemerythrin|nr:bacteriohemerythrin [Lentisphaerota bacterium]MBT4820838.1 bacteriohemerythrin [Lentisphaerota bacterium]MBT5612272.1 bacteriohemerythrin [Lentisphaerota bacterium]MBT7060750.1 bacteriohemerythrin [Lentisphaerota bacterium]MBT7845251.1 bacteriohemerythrin [Lentisphaerota bacterium]